MERQEIGNSADSGANGVCLSVVVASSMMDVLAHLQFSSYSNFKILRRHDSVGLCKC